MRCRSRVRPTLAALCAAVLVTACAGDDPVIDLDGAPDDLTSSEDDAESDAAGEPQDTAGSDEDVDAADAGPSPDAALAAEPCGPHQGREADAFIEVVSPVEDQQVGDGSQVELVGCSNVFEATIVWELVADDEVLTEDVTTATCGSGCVGEFRETIDLSAGADHDGSVELHVISPDASDGEGQELREIVPLAFD